MDRAYSVPPLVLGLGLGLSRYLDSLTNGDTDQLFNPNILSLMT